VAVALYFSDYFNVDPEVLEDYGAFDISVVSDLPLFVDPFLLFNGENKTYQRLHDEIIKYLLFLRDEAADGKLDPKLIDAWYRFKEVKQNWLGFTQFSNEGAGLGKDFAGALHSALADIFKDFGGEEITLGTHLEKLCLIRPGVGRDSISDFTTNLIKGYLCAYTAKFAKKHLDPKQCAEFHVTRAGFSYKTKTWVTKRYYLPKLRNDYVLLTPADLLTRDDTWISHSDMEARFSQLPAAVPDQQQRALINQYFKRVLGKKPTKEQERAAILATIQRFPELIDRYIRLKEDDGERAISVSTEKVERTHHELVAQIKAAVEQLTGKTDFYDKPWTSYDECLERVKFFKQYIENQEGYRLLNKGGKGFSRESEVQLAFGLVWLGSDFDLNRETNNGRGPVDYKASFGSGDKGLSENSVGVVEAV
jgi:hypothetical protein